MSAWDELQTWLTMNVGTFEAEQAFVIALRLIEEEREACAKIAEQPAWSAPTETGEWALREAAKVIAASIRSRSHGDPEQE